MRHYALFKKTIYVIYIIINNYLLYINGLSSNSLNFKT